jgi:gamma-glutamylaminecyclotransferase
MKVFVYGTLKRGYGNNRLLSEQTFVGEGYTGGFFDMINSGFPVLIPNDDGHVVKGEVFEIDTKMRETLSNLDALEGYHGTDGDNMYDRKEIRVKLAGTEDWVTCQIYVGSPKYWRRNGDVTDPTYIKEDGQYLEWGR